MAVLLSPVGGVAAQFFTNAGVPLSGGKIYTYAAGTSTPQATYTTGAGNIQHSNPIVLDAAGRVPTGEIWLTDGLSYKFVLKDANDVLIATYDNIVGINSNFVNFVNQQEIQTATAGQTVFTLTTMEYQPGIGNLSVFVDGVNQYGPGAQYAYTETSSTVVTFVSGLHVGALVKFTTTEIQNSGIGDASQITYTYPAIDAVEQSVEERLAQYVSVKDFGAVGDGVTDDTLAFQNAVDSLTDFQTLIAEGEFLLSTNISLRKSNVVYNFQAAKFILTGTNGINFGAGMLVGDSDNLSFFPENVTILGGNYYPAGDSQVYPTASFNPVAVIIGQNITILNPKIYAVQSTRAISIQTDTGAIDGVYVSGLEVYGDGNAVDGVDIGYAGTGTIKNVYVQGIVNGCKRGLHVYPGGSTDTISGLYLDLIINDSDVIGAAGGRIIDGNVKLEINNATTDGVILSASNNVSYDIRISGKGSGLGTAVNLIDGAYASNGVTLNCDISTSDSNLWTKGLYPQMDFAVYPNVNIEDCVTGIYVSGFKEQFGNVTFKNCTTEINNPNLSTDSWATVTSFGSWTNPVIEKRSFSACDGVNAIYGIDLAGTSTITITTGSVAKIFGNVAEFSGMLIVNGTAGTGAVAMYLMGNGNSYLVGGDTTIYSAASGTASKINVYYDGSSYATIQNNTAGSVTLRVFATRTRNAP